MDYCEVVTREGHTIRAKLVYAGSPEEAMQTAKAYGLRGQVVEVRILMLESVWIPPEVMPPEVK